MGRVGCAGGEPRNLTRMRICLIGPTGPKMPRFAPPPKRGIVGPWIGVFRGTESGVGLNLIRCRHTGSLPLVCRSSWLRVWLGVDREWAVKVSVAGNGVGFILVPVRVPGKGG